MWKTKTFHKKKVLTVFLVCAAVLVILMVRLAELMLFESEYYAKKAQDLHERERDIKAQRGEILDASGKVLAANRTAVSYTHLRAHET